MANWTVAGLIASIAGTVLVGFVAPRHSGAAWDVGTVAADSVGQWAPRIGWGLILLGFVGQLVGALGW